MITLHKFTTINQIRNEIHLLIFFLIKSLKH